MTNTQMAAQAANKDGFIAALDQSGGSTPKGDGKPNTAVDLTGVTLD